MRISSIVFLPLAFLPLTGCMEAPPPDASLEGMVVYDQLSLGYSPKMGQVRVAGHSGGSVFTTYDFSIGAYDASAWFDSEAGRPRFTLSAYPDENPDAEVGRLRITTHFDTPQKAGSTGVDALVEITLVEKRDGRRLSSFGAPSVLVIDGFTKQNATATSGYGHVTGHFAAQLCPVDREAAVRLSGGACEVVIGTFETEVQYQPLELTPENGAEKPWNPASCVASWCQAPPKGA